MGAYRNQCQSTVLAPFGGDPRVEHQCSGSPRHQGKHYCGCGYEWTTETVIEKEAGE